MEENLVDGSSSSESESSDLTDIGSNSDVVQPEVVPAPRSRRTEKKRV
jgi:hypothetical protein